jgi:hypothetical protein
MVTNAMVPMTDTMVFATKNIFLTTETIFPVNRKMVAGFVI